MLNIKTRQQYLKNLGLYKGKIDKIEGKLTKEAYLKLQKKYFPKQEQDGIYGKNTEILLRNAERVRIYTKNFKLEEFKCGCKSKYCTGYHKLLNKTLLKYIQSVRDKYGSTTITSGLRCPRFNTICGGASFSKHMEGKALDFYNEGTRTYTKRVELIKWFIKKINATYAYCYKYGKTKWTTYTGSHPSCNYPEMGNAVHIDVK